MRISLSWLKIYLRTLYYKKKHNLDIGRESLILGPIELSGRNDGKIILGDNTRICQWSVLRAYCGTIVIGDNCSINSFCHISGNGGVFIGNNVRIATQCVIISANHNFDKLDISITQQGEKREKIVIEDDCWLGAGVKVLAGVTIGRGSVLGAGTVVSKNVPPYSVVVGVPGKVIKSRVEKGDIIE